MEDIIVLVLLVVYFPSGLSALLFGPPGQYMIGYTLAGWAFYVVLATVIAAYRGHKHSYVLYVILVAALVANLAGCSTMFKGMMGPVGPI